VSTYDVVETMRAAWDRGAIQVQAERAMRAEQQRDALVATVAQLSAELTAKDAELRQLRAALAAMTAGRWQP